jgi:hypothetical protein
MLCAMETKVNTFNLRIGVEAASLVYPWDGWIDEVRISKINQSQQWISTEYNNQNDPYSFVSIGPEESSP